MRGAHAGIALASVLLVAYLVLPANTAPPPIQRPMEIVEARTEGDGPVTVDPALCYDVASAELLMNVYDTLIVYDGEHVDKFLPQLATEWTNQNITGETSPEGLSWSYRYTFKIRQGVPFQDSTFGNLTTEDVEYCYERAMVMDMDGGPQWMLYEPLLNGEMATFVNQTEYDPEGNITDRVFVGKCIDHAVESNVTHVWFNLAFPGVYTPFMQIMTQPSSSIYSKAWANSLGRPNWNGNWGDHTGWWTYHKPAAAPFDEPSPTAMGSGPFMFEALDRVLMQWSVNRFTDYWRGWPADWPTAMGTSPKGFINHFVTTWAYDWPTRKAMFLNGDIDFCAVPRANEIEVTGQNGVRDFYPLPSLSVNALFFNLDIDPTSPFGLIYDFGILGENGIPRDFFGNSSWGIHTRKAFACCIDYDSWLSENYGDEAQRPATAIIPGISYYDPTVPGYDFNLTRAGEEFQRVPTLWDTGFTVNLAYLVSCWGHNPIKSSLFNLIKQAVESLNPKFHVTVSEVPWCYLCCEPGPENFPAFILGWLADYPDAHNFAWTFYHSKGTFCLLSAYSNPTLDNLIERGIDLPDGPERAQLYHEIQQLVVSECPSVTLAQPVRHHFERDWICGWYHNPGGLGIYAYNLWKWYYTPHAQMDSSTQPTSNYLSCDIDYNGKVDMKDFGMAAASFGTRFGPPSTARWLFRCDFNNDRKIDMKDISGVAKDFGKKSVVWNPS